MSKLVLIDGNAILHRAYHALPPLTTKKGEPINAVYGFVSMLMNLILTLKPTHLAVAFDEKEKTFRKKKYEGYQAKRPPMDEWLVSQIGKSRDFLSAAGIPFYSKSGFEADDVIGTIVFQANTVDEVIIVTGDRDIFQLINNKVKVFVPIKGLKEGKLYDKEEVLKEFEFNPIQMVDYKALVGDSSDNYPGVSGIGPKTARDLIVKYKTVENIYKNLGDIPEKVRIKLVKGKKDAFFFKKLAKIESKVDMDFGIENCMNWNMASPQVIKLFSEYGFITLTKRVKEFGRKVEEQKQMILL